MKKEKSERLSIRVTGDKCQFRVLVVPLRKRGKKKLDSPDKCSQSCYIVEL